MSGSSSFATTSDGEHVDNPRWGRAAADRLATAQQRLQRAKRRSKNRERKRETVAARHRKIANQRKDFHHKQARAHVGRYDLWWWKISRLPTCCGGPNPCPTRTNPAHPGEWGPGEVRALAEASVTPAGASSSRFCAPKRKMLGVSRLRSTPGTPPMAARPVVTQHRRIASPKRISNARDARIPPRLTNTPHVTSSGLDWPFTRKPREKKPAASSRQRSHVSSADDGVQRPSSDVPGGPLDERGRSAVVVLMGVSPRSASRVRVPTGESVRLGSPRRVRRPS